MTSGVFVIAEAGVNHDGSPDTAIALVEAAARAGADCVKFQTFRADRLATARAAKAAYQSRTTDAGESQMEMLRRLELSADAHRRIAGRCRELGVEFLSTPFDPDSLAFLVDEIGVARVKIPSGEIINGALLLQAARKAPRIVLSTGMATLSDVEAALAVLVWGTLEPERLPSTFDEVVERFARTGTEPLRGRVTILHCTTEYPAPFEDANLAAMETMRRAFGLPVGFSDHTPGIAASIAAAALGASVIEKHFTLDRSRPGPDHAASLEPDELDAMIAGIRAAEAAVGRGFKRPVGSEIDNRPTVRRSLVAKVAIEKGAAFDLDNLTAKRPGGGISPMRIFDYVGRRAERAFAADEPIG